MAHPAADPSSVSVWPSRHSQCPGVWDSRVVSVFEPGSCRVRSARSYGIRDLIWAMRGSMLDRKSTRLNSSHGYISYAVFCLKKKKNNRHTTAVREVGTQS